MKILIVLFSVFLVVRGQQQSVLNRRCAAVATNAITFIANNFNCNGYHICQDKKWLGNGNCAPNLYFSNGVCDYAQYVQCIKCEASRTDLHRVPIFGSCNQYALCINEEVTIFTCGAGTIYPGGIDDSCTLNPTTGDPVPCKACPHVPLPGFVDVPHFSECNRFIRCSHISTGGVFPEADQQPKTCPTNLKFDEPSRECLPAAEATCEWGDAPGECPPTGIVYIASLANCYEYYICVNGVKETSVQTCGTGLGFDIAAGQCLPLGGMTNPTVCIRSRIGIADLSLDAFKRSIRSKQNGGKISTY